MTDLTTRYGAPSPARRRALIALVTALAVAALAWLAWAAIYQSTPQVRSAEVRFTVPDDHTAVIVLSVAREDADVVATCFVRALSEDHTLVGEATAVVDSGPLEQEVEITIRTERRAIAVQRLGCTAPGQPQRK